MYDQGGGAWQAARRNGTPCSARTAFHILPTRHGILFVTLLLGSINYNNSLGYAFTFLLGGVGLVSILHAYRNLAGQRLTPGRARAVFAGQDGRFSIHPHSGAQVKRCVVGPRRK